MAFLIVALYVLPSLLATVTLWTQRRDSSVLPNWRRAVFVVGLLANIVSSTTLFAFAWYSLNQARLPAIGLARAYFVLFGLGLLSAPLAASGKSISRFLLMANGLLTSILWYFLLALMADSV